MMRTPTTGEVRILQKLIERAAMPFDAELLLVDSMDDGGMGSLKIGKTGNPYEMDAFKSDYSETIMLKNNS